MNPRNRDLLVFTRKEKMNQDELERQIELLNDLFYIVEASNAAYIANEVIDVNRNKIISKLKHVRTILQEQRLTPFVFISNKN
ncbi:MAG TPA: hypothetical protein VEV62_03125 [Parafilimonas sp.]|nr:hypothetical protein [Parafilimonas sp.]